VTLLIYNLKLKLFLLITLVDFAELLTVAFTLPIVLLLLFVVNLYFSDVGMGGPREAGKDGHGSYKMFTDI